MRRYASLELKLNNCKWSVHLIGDKGCLMIHHLHIHCYEHCRVSYLFALQSVRPTISLVSIFWE